MTFVVPALLLSGGLVLILLQYKPHPMNNIDAFLKHEVETGQSPSVQYAFFEADSVIYEGRYGVSRVRSGTPVDASTTYHLFSVTKTFTALAVLQLVQAGKIHLAHPASDYLPDWPYSGSITIAQLLNHTAGIPNPMPLRWIHPAAEHREFNRNRFFKEIFRQHPEQDADPGTTFKYSNLGYVLLGQLIEQVSGQTYEAYITHNILEPLQLERAALGFEIDNGVHATGYHPYWSVSNALFGFLIDKKKFMGPKEGPWKPFLPFYPNGTAYGGMMGSAGALIQYAQDLLKKNSLLLHEDYRKILFTEDKINNKPTGMSCSWFTGKLKGHTYFAHAGGGGGYYVELRVYPSLGVGSVILFNRSGMKDERILDKADQFFVVESQRINS